jgi:hypothetical protein
MNDPDPDPAGQSLPINRVIALGQADEENGLKLEFDDPQDIARLLPLSRACARAMHDIPITTADAIRYLDSMCLITHDARRWKVAMPFSGTRLGYQHRGDPRHAEVERL